MVSGFLKVKLRPLRLAFLVEPTDRAAIKHAVETASFLWGGAFSPIIPAYRKLPKFWAPDSRGASAESVVNGYLDAFDPDYVVKVGRLEGEELKFAHRSVIKCSEILEGVEDDGTPKFGVGMFEVLQYFAEHELKYVRHEPIHIRLPEFSTQHELFLASVFGKFPPVIDNLADDGWKKLPGIQAAKCTINNYFEFLSPDNLFIRRLGTVEIHTSRVRSFRRCDCIFLMNPCQEVADKPGAQKLAVDFVEENYFSYRGNPNLFNDTMILKSRTSSIIAVEEFGRLLKPKLSPPKNPRDSKIVYHFSYPLGWPTNGTAQGITQELRKAFPNFAKAREDLIEQRILLSGTTDLALLNCDHVILGWALFLRGIIQRFKAEPSEQLRERILQQLEPAASDDNKARAIHLATLLSFLEDEDVSAEARKARSTLLGLWVYHHNASVNEEDLETFVSHDLRGYAEAVEVLFLNQLPGSFEATLILPLARAWRDSAPSPGILDEIASRWLRLIFPGNASGSKDRDQAPPIQMVPAATPEQLRLSYAATSLISFRPKLNLLPALLDFLETPKYCYADRTGGGQIHRLPIKSSVEPLGVLLRWGYTERSLSELSRLAAAAPAHDRRKLHEFAQLFRMASLPEEIGPAQAFGGDVHDAAFYLAEFRQRLIKDQNENETVFVCSGIGRLASRRDLPSLSSAELQAIVDELNRLLERRIDAAAYPGSWENQELLELMPWLARYAPQVAWSAHFAVWKYALGSKDPVPAILGLEGFLPGSAEAKDIVCIILERGKFLTDCPNFLSVVAPLTEMVLLHGSLSQVMTWLRLIEGINFEGGGSLVVSILPLPETFRALRSPELAGLVRQELERVLVLAKQNSCAQRVAHWLWIYSYVAQPSDHLGMWALQLADEIGSDNESAFALFSIICESGDSDVCLQALSHPAFRQFQLGVPAWRWRFFAPKNDLVFDRLNSIVSFTVSGWLLSASKSVEELRKWGDALSKAAMDALDSETADWVPRSKISVRVNEQSNLARIDIKAFSDGGSSWHDISSPVWGIDRSARRASPTQRDYDQALAQYRSDMAKWRQSNRREFFGFNAASPLFKWSQAEPEAFFIFAEEFLNRLGTKDVNIRLNFWFFASCLQVAMLRLRPAAVCKSIDLRLDESESSVLCSGVTLPWEVREFWSPKFNTVSEVLDIRKRLLIDAPNDQTIMSHALASHGSGNECEFQRISNLFLEAGIARDRALGVTMLGFQGNGSLKEKLAQIAQTDPSLWVREQASWCLDVCATEQACKLRYREILSCKSLDALATGLMELAPAFSPLARAWRRLVEQEVSWAICDNRMSIYLRNFWYRWDNDSSNRERVQICGRKLEDFCRGERLSEGVTSRQAPWWKLGSLSRSRKRG